MVARFGARSRRRHGGTGIAFYKGAIFAEMKDRILRYPLADDAILPKGTGDGRLGPADHRGSSHASLRDQRQGDLYVDVASATNSCQLQEPDAANSPGDSPATSCKPGPASGATTPTRRGSISRRPSASPRAAQRRRHLLSIRRAGSTPPSTAATSSTRTGRTSTRPRRARTCRARNSCSLSAAPIMAGRNAIST